MAAPTPGVAQSPGEIAEATADTETLVVTGSRLARPEVDAATPVAVINAAQIERTGAANIQDVLATLPAVGQNISRTTSNFDPTNNGVATVNLRNLGNSRTLVLINGRRSVGIAGTSAVDLNNISADLVERVEVVTGGASAVYGSEAVAGVVNFVLKNDFEGLRGRAQATLSSRGDAARQFATLTGGWKTRDGRGHLVINGTFDRDAGLRSVDRAYSATDFPNRSSFSAQGLFDVTNLSRPGASATFSPSSGNTFTFAADNSVKGYQGANIDGYDRAADRYLSLPLTRYQATLLGSYELSDTVKLYAEGNYARASSRSSLEPTAISNSSAGGALAFDGSAYAGIPVTSPYVPVAIRDRAIANGASVIQFRRRSNEIFNRDNAVTRNFYRGVFGLRGELSDRWRYDVSYERSDSRDHTSAAQIYSPNYGAALDNEIGPDGAVRCSSEAARAAGCVPMNIFGFGTVSAAAADFLQTYTGPTRTITLSNGRTVQLVNGQRVRYDYRARSQQDVVSGSVQGDLFSLWGGPARLVAGGEYRREKSSQRFDPFTQAGLTSGFQLSDTQGRFDVAEGFGEIALPIVEDRPLLHYLGFEGAARYANYSTIGDVWSWKAGATWAPVRDIRLRGMFSRATRAPNIGELFAANSQVFPAIVDPCDQAGGRGDGAALAPLPVSCAAVPGIAATAAASGAFAYSTAQLQTVNGLVGGNAALRAEIADTITAGGVLTPTPLQGFSLSVDYYRIKVKRAIGIIGQQISVTQCLQTGNPIFCDNVTRDASGFVTQINATNINTASILVEGLDVAARYSLPLGFAPDTRINLDALYNRRFKQQQTPFPGAVVQDELGQAACYSCGRLGSGFKNRVVANVALVTGAIEFAYRLDYLGPLVDSLAATTPVRIPAYDYHNFQLRVGADRMDFYVGVNNAFDKQPPRFGDTNAVAWPGTQTVANTYDLYGRMIYAGMSFRM